MSQKGSRDGLNFGAGGDTTAGPISLSEITVINPSFMNLIGASEPQQVPSPTPPTPPPSQQTQILYRAPTSYREPQSSVKQASGEITKQFRFTRQRQPLLSTQKQIEDLMKENFELKLKLYNMKRMSNKELENCNMDGVYKDLVADLMTSKDELERKLEERDKKDKMEEERRKSLIRESSCQTNLDGLNIEDLIRASVTLKRQREQERHQNFQSSNMKQSRSTHLFSHQAQSLDLPSQPKLKPQEQPIITQLHYPSVTIPKQVVTHKQLTPDEKDLLETLYRVDGLMTFVLDKLKSVSDVH